MLVSIIIPCFQNENQLSETVKQIHESISGLQDSFEVILVDDGSTDKTWSAIVDLAQKHKNVFGIKLKRNIGAYNAILAGFDHAKGDALLVMAADGDDPPDLITSLLQHLPQHDAVLANRVQSEKGLSSTLSAKLFYRLIRMVGARNIPQGGSDYLVVKRQVFEECIQEGFKSGNTLIRLVQFADSVLTIPYTKGITRPTTWSLSRKLALFVQTVNQFIFIPFVKPTPTPYEVESVTDR